MTRQTVAPINQPVNGIVTVPGSKSITTRALLLAALAKGSSYLTGMLASDDSEAFVTALQALGVQCTWDRTLTTCQITGCDAQFPQNQAALYCRDAGTATRFLIPACAAMHGQYHFTASARMSERPIGPLLGVLQAQGTEFAFEECAGQMPFIMRSQGLFGGKVQVDIRLSSQFLSGLLMASPLAQTPMLLNAGNLCHKPYVAMTIEMMADFGIEVIRMGNTLLVHSGQYQGCEYAIEPDASTASYFFAMAALTQGTVTVIGLKRQALQGDTQFLDTLEQMGAQVRESTQGISVTGPKQLHGLGSYSMSGFSDTFMTVAALAVFADSPTTITGLAHTRLQESDRVASMAEGLACLGIRTDNTRDSLTIYPSQAQYGEVSSCNDHRIAMSLSLVGLRGAGVVIHDAHAVAKTCPNYFQMLAALVG